MTGADWIWGLAALCELAGQSIYLLGSEPPIAHQAATRLRGWYPQLDVVGSHHGYFELGSPHSERVIEDIVAAPPADRARRDGHTEAGAVGRSVR